MQYEQITTAAKASPPIVVTGASLAGIPVADWVQWLTAIYLVLVIGHKCWTIYKEWRASRKAKTDE